MNGFDYNASEDIVNNFADTINDFILNCNVEDGVTENNYYYLATNIIGIIESFGIGGIDKDYKLFVAHKLWEEFGDIPMNPETETIDEDWYFFYRGTHREEIWHWFEDTFKISVAKDLMYGN